MGESREQLVHTFEQWIGFVQQLGEKGEQAWRQSLAPGKWSVHEVVAHIALWDDYFFEHAIQQIAAEAALTLVHIDFDKFNAAAREWAQAVTSVELAQHAIRSRERIIGAIRGLSGELYDKLYQDADGQPFAVAQYLRDFIWHDEHHCQQILFIQHRLLEEMALNGWPALRTLAYDGWLLRFADGYTKRSNSVSAIYGHTLQLAAKIKECEQLYKRQGLRPIFKITPFNQPSELDSELAARSYERIDNSLVQTFALNNLAAPLENKIRLVSELTEEWLDVFAAFSGITPAQRETTRSMLQNCPLARAYAVLYDQGKPVACGMAAVENGWVSLYDVITEPSSRGQGFGRKLVLALLHWGKTEGSSSAFLLVVKANEPAIRLYAGIGFATAYEYWYRQL
jgi:GNAT superfamily N-acetyltransferase